MFSQQFFANLRGAFVISVLPLTLVGGLPTAVKAASSSAQKFDAIYVFGDSLSDPGNTFEATQENIPPPPYYDGRFSNGPNWIDYLGQDLGLNPTPVTDVISGSAQPTEGINFAFGGATTGTDNTISLTFPVFAGLPALQQEIQSFKSLVPTADPDALYIVWAGANDYLPTQGSFVPYTNPEVPLKNLSDAVTSLANAGAKNILVANLPDLGNTPVAYSVDQSFPGTSAALNALTEAHNTGLSTALNDLSQSFDINIIPFYVDSLFEEVLDNPGKFGFTNTTDACISDPVACAANPNGYFFWDQQHPTTAVHQILAERAYSALEPQPVPEPSAEWGLLALGALGAAGWLKHKQKKASNDRL